MSNRILILSKWLYCSFELLWKKKKKATKQTTNHSFINRSHMQCIRRWDCQELTTPDGPIVKGHSSAACQLPRMVTLKGKEGKKSSHLCSAPTAAFSCLPKPCKSVEMEAKLALSHLPSTSMIRGVSLPSLSVYRHQVWSIIFRCFFLGKN